MQCEVCGNHYEDSFTVTLADETYVFDCFECAIHALAPTCAHCGCKVIGHGLARDGEIFCGEHCVRMSISTDDSALDDDVDDDELDEGFLEVDLEADDAVDHDEAAGSRTRHKRR